MPYPCGTSDSQAPRHRTEDRRIRRPGNGGHEKNTSDTEWFLTWDIIVRFSSKRSVFNVYEQRAPVKSKEDNKNRIHTHDGHISPTILPTRHVSNESTESSLHKIFVSCELLRGKDSGELPTLFKDSLNDTYEDLILNNDSEFQPPKDFIDSLVTSISVADLQNEANITLGPKYLFHLFELSRIYKVGGIAIPYATIE